MLKLGVAMYACDPRAMGERGRRIGVGFLVNSSDLSSVRNPVTRGKVESDRAGHWTSTSSLYVSARVHALHNQHTHLHALHMHKMHMHESSPYYRFIITTSPLKV